MPVNDTRAFERTKAACLDSLCYEPLAEVPQGPSLGRIKSQSGPACGPIELIVVVFPVKHAA